MKVRNGFVSNSSSSSFTCDVCGVTESGWDFDLYEAGFIECENDHIFCKEHSLYPPLNINEYDDDKIIKRFYNINYNDYQIKSIKKEFEEKLSIIKNEKDKHKKAEIIRNLNCFYHPRTYCPICNLEFISDKTIIKYLCLKTNCNIQEIKKEIQKKFKTLEEIESVIGNKNG